MNQKLAKQTKEYMLEILDWTNNPNRKLALDCINEIAEEVLTDLTEHLQEEEEKEKQNCNCPPESIGQHLSDGNYPSEKVRECAGSCENCGCNDLTPPPGTLPPVDENGNINPNWDPVKDS